MFRIGTPGLGQDSEAWVNSYKGIPNDISPIADIEFPNKEPGGKPIKVRLPFTTRASPCWFHSGPLPVPENAGEGKAKVTVHFSDWITARVAPLTFEVAIEAPKKAPKP
jgi:hypothetical protein